MYMLAQVWICVYESHITTIKKCYPSLCCVSEPRGTGGVKQASFSLSLVAFLPGIIVWQRTRLWDTYCVPRFQVCFIT